MDSCKRFVVPNAQTDKFEVKNFEGEIIFHSNGTGIVKADHKIFCKEPYFNWEFVHDSLFFKVATSNFKSYSKTTFVSNDEVKIEHLFGCGTKGMSIWYDLVIKRNK